MSILESVALRINGMTNRVGRMPILVLMPHSRCNCRCLMCDIWRANKNLQELSSEFIGRHVEAMQDLGVRWIVLSGGEALMHTNLWNLCEALSCLNAKTTLLSTGLLLERHVGPISEWVDEIIVSLDGSALVHDRIRNIPRAYEKLEKGVAALRSGAPSVEIGARCVLQRENYHDFAGVVEAARSLDLDWISFLAADVSSEAFNRPGGWEDQKVAEVSLTAAQCDEFEAVLRKSFADFAGDYESGYIVEPPDKLLRIVKYFRALNGSTSFPRQRCNAPWVSAVVEPDGQVRPCYFHAAYGRMDGGGLKNIINAPAAVAFRRNLDVNKNAICQRCVCTLNFK
jgi:MoaA/NifB/PqqE/SkfB family radical SAM enzyme